MKKHSNVIVAGALVMVLVGGGSVLGAGFKRGEVNGDSRVNVSDAVQVLRHLFQAKPMLCLDAADYNDDGSVDVADAIGLLGFLFGGTARPPEPFTRCGPDPTADDLDCIAASCYGPGVIFLIDRSANMGQVTVSGEVVFAVVKRGVIRALADLPDDAVASVMLVDWREDVVAHLERDGIKGAFHYLLGPGLAGRPETGFWRRPGAEFGELRTGYPPARGKIFARSGLGREM